MHVDCIDEVKVEQLGFILLAAYFVFNISYFKGCSNDVFILEVLFASQILTRQELLVSIIITSLNNH